MKRMYGKGALLFLLAAAMVLPVGKGKRVWAAEEKAAKLARPSLSCEDRTASKVYLKWKKVKNAENYIVYRSREPKGTYRELGATEKTEFVDETVKAGKTYYYKLRAFGEEEKSQEGTAAPSSSYSKRLKVTAKSKVKKTAYVGDSIMSGLKEYGIIKGKGRKVITKIGVATSNFYTGTPMKTLLNYNPDRMYIMLGVNALEEKPSSSWLDYLFKYYKKIIKKCRKKNPEVQIVLLPVAPTRSSRVRNKDIGTYNKRVVKLAKQYKTYYYDYTAFLKNGDGSLKSKYSAGDGIHWQISAYRKFKKKLDAYGKKLD